MTGSAALPRPALEALRDLVASGAVDTVLVWSVDRLSRNFAYQMLLRLTPLELRSKRFALRHARPNLDWDAGVYRLERRQVSGCAGSTCFWTRSGTARSAE